MEAQDPSNALDERLHLVTEAARRAERLDLGGGAREAVAGHVGEEVVLDLVLEPSEDEGGERARRVVARRPDLERGKIDGLGLGLVEALQIVVVPGERGVQVE